MSIDLTFSDAPRCKPGTEQTSVGSINMHSIDVRCEVEADPAEQIRFSWTYNNTRNVSPVSVLRLCVFLLLSDVCLPHIGQNFPLTFQIENVFFSHFVSFRFLALCFVCCSPDYIYAGSKFTNHIEWFGEHNDISGTIRLGTDARVLGKQCCRPSRNTMSHSHHSS